MAKEATRDDEAILEEAILEEARERFEYSESVDRENRERANEDTRFVYVPGAQWSDDVRIQRKNWQDPCYEFNQLKQFIHQVVNDQRQNRPGIRVHPAGNGASEEVAKIEQGMIRGIEYKSQAEAIYDQGYQSAVVGGRGYWRVISDYISPKSMDQEILIKPIADPNMVRLDPDYQEPDGSDRMWGFVLEAVPKKEFSRLYPKAEPLSYDDIDVNWFNGDEFVYIADYYRRVATTRTLVRVSNGAEGYKDEMPEPPPEITEIASREVDVYKIEWYKIAGGQQVLEEYECPGDIIPVICVPGDETVVDGKRLYQGLIRSARDGQSMFNYGMTQQAIHLALSPRAPWVAEESTYQKYQQIYKDANIKNIGVLPWISYDDQGRQVPAPQRTAPSMPDAGWINWTQQMSGLIKSTIGMYENSLGLHGQETSGRAILAREKQGDNATFHYVDNHSRAIALTGRIISQWIPYYYDTERVVHIVGQDNVRDVVKINQTAPNPQNPLQAIKLNDVTVGDYAITVEAGASYGTKRQEAADFMTQALQAAKDPVTGAVLTYLAIKNQDMAGSDEASDMLKLTLPSPIQQYLGSKDKKQAPIPPEVQQQLQEQQQHLEAAAKTMDAMHQKVQEAESGQQAQMAKIQVERDLAMQKMKMDVELANQKSQMDSQAMIQKAQIESETKLKVRHMELLMEEHLASAKSPLDLAQQSADIQDTLANAELHMAQVDAIQNPPPELPPVEEY